MGAKKRDLVGRDGAPTKTTKKKKKDSGGLLGFAKKTAGGALGNVLDTLSAPQQALFKGYKGVRHLASGDFKEALGDFGRAGAELGSLATGAMMPGVGNQLFKKLAGDDISLTHTLSDDPNFKLGYGLETIGGVLLDPATYATLGTGAAAKTALSTAAKAGLGSLKDDVVRQGLKQTLRSNPAAEGALRSAFSDSALAAGKKAGSKGLEKTINKNMKALTRAQGGLGFRVPGMANQNIIKGSTIRKGVELGGEKSLGAAGRGIKASRGGSAIRHAFVPGARMADDLNVGREGYESYRGALARHSSEQSTMLNNARAEWDAAVRATNDLMPKGSKYDVLADESVGNALHQGEEARAALVAARPELEPLVTAADRIRKQVGEAQFQAGVLGQNTASTIATAQGKLDEATEAVAANKELRSTLEQQAKNARKNAKGSEAEAKRLKGLKNRTPEQDELLKQVQKMARDGRAKVDSLNVKLGREIGKGQGLKGAAKTAKNTLDELPVDRAGMIDEDKYLRRVMTKDATKALGKDEAVMARLSGGNASLSTKQGAAQQRSIAPQFEPKALNDAIETLRTGGAIDPVLAADEGFMDVANKLIKASPDKPIRLFDEGAGLPLLQRTAEASRAVATAKFIKDLGNIDGAIKGQKLLYSEEAFEAAAKNNPALDAYVKADIPGHGVVMVPKSLEKEIAGAMRVMGHPDTAEGIIKGVKYLQSLWKTYATALLPGGLPFMSRNARSNVYLNLLDGMAPSHPAYKQAMETLTKARNITQGKWSGKNLSDDIARNGLDSVLQRELGDEGWALFEGARSRGILDKGFFDVDFTDAPMAQQKLGIAGAAKGPRSKRAVKQLGLHGGPARKGRQMNEAIEHHARFSNYIYNVNKMGDLDAAAARTKQVLFDYTELTPSEQNIFKMVVPFYTFIRKNLPAQYKGTVMDPARATLPLAFHDAVTDPVDESAPDYQQRAGATTLLPGIQGAMKKMGLGGLTGLVSTPDRPLGAATDVIEPLTGLAAMAIPGKDQGEPEGWQSYFRGLSEPVGGPLAAMFKLMMEEGTGKSSFTGARLPDDGDARARRIIDAIIPGLGRTTRLSGTANAELGGTEAGRGDTTELSEILRFLTGIRMDKPQAGGGSGSQKKKGGAKKRNLAR